MALDKKSSVKLGNGQLVPAVGVVDSSGNLVTFGGGGGGGGDASAANQTLQLTELRSIAGLQIPPHDNIAVTYRTSGNGTGKIDQVIYKTGAATVATLTLVYDASNRLSTVTKS